MAMKHTTLPTSKLVLISRVGFSNSATRKAASFGVDTYSFTEAQAKDWRALFGQDGKDTFTIWSYRIRGCLLSLKRDPAVFYPARPELTVFDSEGKPEGALADVIDASVDLAPEFMQGVVDFATNSGESLFGADFLRRPSLFVKSSDGTSHQIAVCRLAVEAVALPESFRFQAARFRDRPVAFAEGASPIGRLTITLLEGEPDGLAGSARVTGRSGEEVDIAEVYFTPELGDARGKLAFMTGKLHGSFRGPA